MDIINENKLPRIQVLLSTYNGDNYLEEQLDSIINQKNVYCDILIRDDGSSDKSVQTIKNYQGRVNAKIKIIEGNNIGFANSFFCLVQNSGNFDFFAFSDQDDVWLEEKLYRGISMIEGNANRPEMYFCNAYLVDSKLEPMGLMFEGLKLPQKKYNCILECLSAGCTIVFNRKARDMFLKGDSRKIDYHDFWLYDICSLFGKVVYDSNAYIYYRQHSSNVVGSHQSFVKVWKQRYTQIKHKTHSREYLTQEIIRCFYCELDPNDKHQIELLANYRTSLLNKLRLLFLSRFKMRTFKQMFWLKIHILIGNV